MNNILDGSFIDQIRKTGPARIEHTAETATNEHRVCVKQAADSKYQVFHGNLLLATFGSSDAAEQYAGKTELQYLELTALTHV